MFFGSAKRLDDHPEGKGLEWSGRKGAGQYRGTRCRDCKADKLSSIHSHHYRTTTARPPCKIPRAPCKRVECGQGSAHAGAMRVRIVPLTFFVLVLLHIPLPAQTSAPDPVIEAERLRDNEQPKAAIAILEPLVLESPVQGEGTTLATDRLGFAWNVLGSSYQDLGMFAKAAQCYETAIETLRPMPTAQAKYAAALANLGSLEDSMGQRDSAKALYVKSYRIYQGLGDTGGLTVTSTALASLAYGRKDVKTARRYLAKAQEQAQRTTGLRDDDRAALYSVNSAMAYHDGNYQQAISTVQQALDLWTRAHGPFYFMLSLGLALRAEALAKLGDYPRAIADAQHALAILQAAKGRNNVGYFSTEIVYAEILQASGAKEEATRLRREAGRSLAQFESRQCSGCTINASSFR
jgi:tetratricopeptide (TPR) repeat protein